MELEKNKIREDQNQIEDEMSLREFIILVLNLGIYLKSKWKLISLFCLFGIALGLLYSVVEKPNYNALTTFALEEDKGSSGGLGGAIGIASQFGIDIGGSSGGGAFSTMNLTELMKSRLIVEKTLLNTTIQNNDTITLAEMYLRIKNLKSKWKSNPRLVNIGFEAKQNRSSFTLLQDSILYVIFKKLSKDNLIVQQKDKKITIFSVQVNSENELFSKELCNGIVKETSNFYIESKSKKAKINVEILQKQTDSVRRELNLAISGVANSSDRVYNLNPAFNIKGTPSKNKQVDVQANTEILKQLVIQLELAKVTLRKETPLIQYIDLPILPLEKEKNGKIISMIFGFLISLFFVVIYLLIYRSFQKAKIF